MEKWMIIDILGGIGVLLSILFIITVFINPANKGRFTGRRKIIVASALLVSSVLFTRIATAICATCSFENVFYSVFDTLQIFSLDADYKAFIAESIEVVNTLSLPLWAVALFSKYIVILYIAAPITGGAVLFQIIASIFPRVKLFLYSKCFWKEIMYFSELNEKSLALAKSIRTTNNFVKRPVVVFTDVYTDDEQEKSSELLLSAKALGAICISDDLMHINTRWLFHKKIFLIDRVEMNSVYDFVTLVDRLKKKWLQRYNTEIYLFSTDDAFLLIGDTEKQKVEEEEKAKNSVIEKIRKVLLKNLKIITINGYKNIVNNLLTEVPLYEPLVSENTDNTEKKDLNVTIFGMGNIGMEMFLSTYWYGQIKNCNLCINVVSNESFDEFCKKLDEINPDILDTCVCSKVNDDFSTESTKAYDVFDSEGKTQRFYQLLKIYHNKDDVAQPYFRLRYYHADIKSGDFQKQLAEKIWQNDDFVLADSHYFVVSLGSDYDNMKTADKLKDFLYMENIGEKKPASNVVIAYAIYNSALCEKLNESSKVKVDNLKCSKNIYMHAFASLEKVYAVDNVFMVKHKKQIRKIHDSYEKVRQTAMIKNYEKTQYEYWADVARAFHVKYKLFSAGYVTASVFNCEDLQQRDDKLLELFESYKKEIIPFKGDSDELKKKKRNNPVYSELAWVEHRRWNSFMRSNGFQSPVDYEKFMDEAGKQKSIELKIHACLVEYDAKNAGRGYTLKRKDDVRDCLDAISYKKYEISGEETDYKKYDYPAFDFECNEDGEINEGV